MSLWQLMKKEKLRDIQSYTVLTDYYTKNQKPKEITRLITEMNETNIKPNRLIWSSLLSLYVNAGFPEQAKMIWRKIDDENCVDNQSFSAMVELYSRAGDVTSMEKFLEEKPRWKMNGVSYTSIIKVNQYLLYNVEIYSIHISTDHH